MPRVSSENDEVPKRAPRRRVAKPKAVSVVSDDPVASVRRKAPTALPNASVSLDSRRKTSSKKYVALGLMVSGLALAAFIGYSDKGQIDISAVITERNAKLTAGVSDSEGGESGSVVVPVQNTSNLPNGGLVGSTEPPTPPVPIMEAATTTGTSTASTTDESAPIEEGGETVIDEEETAEPSTETTQTEDTPL